MKDENENKLARIISTIFVPPVFTLFTFLYFANYLETDYEKKIVVILCAIIIGFFSPILLFLFLRQKGKLSDGDALIKEERSFPFLISILFYLAGFFFLLYYEVHIISIAFWFCYISNTLITLLINRYWKISVHTMGAAGPIAALIFAAGWYPVFLIVILAAVAWSRVKLKCHNIFQVTGGAVIAFLSTFIQMKIIISLFN